MQVQLRYGRSLALVYLATRITWRKESEIWLGDARDENFVLTTDGIVPIDIRLWIVEKH